MKLWSSFEMGILLTILMGFLFTIVLGIQFTISSLSFFSPSAMEYQKEKGINGVMHKEET